MENDIKDILAINPYPKIDFDKINALLEWVKDEKNVSSYSDYQKKINELTEPELNWFNKKVEIEIKQKMSNREKLAR